MRSSTLSLIGIALPRSECRTNLGIEYYDRAGELIGFVQHDIFHIHTGYEHYELAKKALNERGVRTEDWDEARALYQKPKLSEKE